MKMRSIYVALTLILFSSGLSFSFDDRLIILDTLIDKPKELFKAYYTLFSKDQEYDINSYVGLRRYKIFSANVNWIKEENSLRGVQVYGITQFTDLTDEEFRDKYLMKPQYVEEFLRTAPSGLEKKISEVHEFTSWPEIDWRGKMNPAKNQGSCGSCWSFGTLAAVEGNYNIQFETLYNLSEQYMVDCDELDGGCSGGTSSSAYTFMTYEGVLETSKRPYLASRQFCDSIVKKETLNIVTGFERCRSCTQNQWLTFLSAGPFNVSVDASVRGFSSYRPKSIDTYFSPVVGACKSTNHVVTAVGSKVIKETGEQIVIVRNSWGRSWGFEGHFSVKSDNHCLVMNIATKPIIVKHTENFNPEGGASIYRSCSNTSDVVKVREGVPDFVSTYGTTIKGFMDGEITENLALYTERNCTGEEQLVSSSRRSKCFRSSSSFKLKEFKSICTIKPEKPGCVWLYEGSYHTGRVITLCKSFTNTSSIGLDVSFVNSVLFGGTGVLNCGISSLVFYREANFQGESFILNYKYPGYTTLEDFKEIRSIFQNTKSILINKYASDDC